MAACALFAIPMLLAGSPLPVAAAAWLAVVIVYLALLRLFGRGFVIEGAVFAGVLSLVVSVAVNAVYLKRTRRPITAPATTTQAPSASPPSDTAPSAPFPADDSPPSPSGKVALRYACDEKYSSDECAPDSRAFSLWLATAKVEPSAERIVHIQGGGPLGAEWNPSNDLVLFVPARDAPRSVRVGPKVIVDHHITAGGWVAFRIPLRDWRRAERRPTARDGLERGLGAEAVRVVATAVAFADRRKDRRALLMTAYGE